MPSGLNDLGLSPDELSRHIAIDIGVRSLGLALRERLGATFVAQRYSRLVIDCNRDPMSSEAIETISDGTVIPGNARLREAERDWRRSFIHEGYHSAIAREIDRTPDRVFVSLHSFTRTLNGVDRPWDIGVLHRNIAGSFAKRFLGALADQEHFLVGDNEPYLFDETDYTAFRHPIARNMPWVEIEVRNDLTDDEGQFRDIVAVLADALLAAEGGI